jgi:REP element-mobilizing transposase RayT
VLAEAAGADRNARRDCAMPFKLRLEFPGATYHVINRGNYRRWIFETTGAKAAFEACLFAACERSEWLLRAFVIMSNHFHLALQTPRGNLVAGRSAAMSIVRRSRLKMAMDREIRQQGRIL